MPFTVTQLMDPKFITRAAAIELIRTLPVHILEECEYRVESYNSEDEDYRDGDTSDLVDALIDFLQYAEGVMGDTRFENAKTRREAKKDYNAMNRLLVKFGFYAVITDEEARESCRGGIGVKMAHFPVIDGVRYTSITSYSGLLEGLK